MKKYKTLKAVFHQFDAPAADTEELRRRELGFETCFPVGEYTLFYTATPQLLNLQEQILLNERVLETLAADIPQAAQRSYLFDLITQEITATNEIEGVHSTRQEILEALEAEPRENKRFREIARLYLELSRGSLEPPMSAEEIRRTYDQLLGEEIKVEDALDGDLFRAGPVWIRDGANQVIHAGAKREKEIVSYLEAMFEHLADEDASFLLSRLVSHFMFEATHPFYDGNGRFGRFFLSTQLQAVLSSYTVLTLSHIINLQKDKYYRAFTEVETPLNRGDATMFAQAMLELVRDAQLYLVKDFSAKKELMKNLALQVEALQVSSTSLSKKAIDSLFIFGQVYLFGTAMGLEWTTLAEVLGRSRNTVRTSIDELETAGLLIRTSSRPLRLRLSDAGREMLFPQTAFD